MQGAGVSVTTQRVGGHAAADASGRSSLQARQPGRPLVVGSMHGSLKKGSCCFGPSLVTWEEGGHTWEKAWRHGCWWAKFGQNVNGGPAKKG